MMNPSSNSSDSTKTREIPIADLHKTFSNQIATLDPQRAQSVASLAAVRSAKASTLAHQQNLLARKFGVKDLRIAAIAQQQAKNTVLQTALSLESVRAQTPAPVASASSYIFHGYVFDSKRQPLPRRTVALYDDQGQWIEELGYGCTDEKGYFIMRHDRAVEPYKPHPAPAPTPQPQPAPAPAPQPSPITHTCCCCGAEISIVKTSTVSPVQVIVKKSDATGILSANIRVFDQKQTLIYHDHSPLQPKLGHVDYRVIIIGDDACTCVPPPDSGKWHVIGGGESKNITPTRDIASLRKNPAQKIQTKPTKVAPSAAPAKSAAVKRLAKKSAAAKSAAPKRKPPRKKKKSK